VVIRFMAERSRGCVDVGTGIPLVLIPGVQGRWEWMGAAVDALSRQFRVLTFTLAGEPTSDHPFHAELGFDNFIAQLDRVLDGAGVCDAVICGVSYGGLIGLRYAALRPSRVRALTLVSAPPPDYQPDDRVERYLRAPRLMAPLFCAGAVSRGWAEMRRALPTWRARAAFARRQAQQVAQAPMRPRLMRDRVRLLESVDLVDAAKACTAPALVITGEPDLDRVVTVASTLRYRELLRQVTVTRLEHTGHLGLVLRPDDFAQRIAEFVADADRTQRTGLGPRAE
jgi:pimeloyl-ACP methyl ester carboxylesterase